MGCECSAFGGYERRLLEFWWGNLRERGHLGDPGVDGRILLRWTCRKYDVEYGLDRAGSGWGQVLGTCECGNGFRVP